MTTPSEWTSHALKLVDRHLLKELSQIVLEYGCPQQFNFTRREWNHLTGYAGLDGKSEVSEDRLCEIGRDCLYTIADKWLYLVDERGRCWRRQLVTLWSNCNLNENREELPDLWFAPIEDFAELGRKNSISVGMLRGELHLFFFGSRTYVLNLQSPEKKKWQPYHVTGGNMLVANRYTEDIKRISGCKIDSWNEARRNWTLFIRSGFFHCGIEGFLDPVKGPVTWYLSFSALHGYCRGVEYAKIEHTNDERPDTILPDHYDPSQFVVIMWESAPGTAKVWYLYRLNGKPELVRRTVWSRFPK